MPDPSLPSRTLPLVDPVSGDFFNIPEGDAPYYLDRGWKPQTAGDVGAAALQGAREIDYGGVSGAAKATVAGVARGATLGASDVAARALGGEETADTLRNLREYHPGLSLGTELVGAVLPSLFTGGTAAPAGAAAAVGRGAARAIGGGIRGAIAGGAAEGALFGAGQGVSELALSQDPLTLEHAAAAIGSNALYGAGVGGVAGGALKGVEVGLGSAKRALDRALLARSEGRAMQAIAGLETEAATTPIVPAGFDVRAHAEGGPIFNGEPTIHAGVPRFSDLDPATYRDRGYVLRPSELQGPNLRGISSGEDMLTDARTAGARDAWRAGKSAPALEIDVDPTGHYFVADGNHRLLAAAAEGDRPILARFRPVEAEVGNMDHIGEDLGRALKAGESVPRAPDAALADLSSLDKKGLDLAERAEVERALAARQPARERFVEMLDEAHKAREPNKEWLAIVGDRNPDKYAREQAKVLFNVDRKVRNLLDNREGLAARPARATEWLQQERQALDGLIERGHGDLEKFRRAALDAPEAVRKELLAGARTGFKIDVPPVIPPKSPIIDDIVAREVQARFPRDVDGVLITPKELAGFEDGRLQIMRNRNMDLQTMIANLERAPQSERLAQIDVAREALGSKTAPPKPEPAISLGREVLKVAAHAVPFGGLVEKATGALGGLRKAVGAGAERVGRAASTFLGKAAPVAGKAAELAPPVATKVLAALRYGEPETDERGRRVAKPEPKTLPELYKARTDEIKSQVQLAPDGTYQMKPAARVKMAARLSGLGVVDPIAADRLESAGAARIAWLASQMPRRPDMAGLPVGPDTWQASDAAMRSWTRKAAAAEDPYGVLERASAGAKARVVPEEIMAMRALQPALLNDYITRIIEGLPERKQRLPYPQRLALSMLTGRPLDPAMTPVVLRELQSMHASVPGTQGGTMAPRAQAQFGSVKRSDPGTPAQRRQGVGL